MGKTKNIPFISIDDSRIVRGRIDDYDRFRLRIEILKKLRFREIMGNFSQQMLANFSVSREVNSL